MKNLLIKDYLKDEFISSIDIEIQYAVRDELLRGIKKYKALGASGILMDINNGEIISMVSLPDFNRTTC